MKKIRYMVVEHPRENEKLQIDGHKITGQVPIHDMLSEYHWARLNDNYVILMGNYSVGHHANLASHSKVSILPPENSVKKILAHPMQDVHKDALRMALSLDDEHTMEDVLVKLELLYGAVFAPQK